MEQSVRTVSNRLTSGLKQHAVSSLDQWFETLPFPSLYRLGAWLATPTDDFRSKYEHLLHFFEAAAEFLSVIL